MLSSRLREIRSEADITQQEVADYLGMTRQAYSAYEAGAIQPNLATLAKLAKYFDVTTDWLLGRTNQRREATGHWVPRPQDAKHIQFSTPSVADNTLHHEHIRHATIDNTITPPPLVKLISIPVYNSIGPYGQPSPQKPQKYIWIDEADLDGGEYFFLEVDRFMTTGGIKANGLFLVRKQNKLENGDTGLIYISSNQPKVIVKFWLLENTAIMLENEARVPWVHSPSNEKIIGKIIEFRQKY